jgi:hypothetical protein
MMLNKLVESFFIDIHNKQEKKIEKISSKPSPYYIKIQKKILNYTIILGSTLYFGYKIFKQFFFDEKKNLFIENLTLTHSKQRHNYIKDVKYNISFKFLNQENEFLNSNNSSLVKSCIKGYLELEFYLKEILDIYLEFSGVLLSLKNFFDKEKVKYEYYEKFNRICIKKESLKFGVNKFRITFTHSKCEKGIFYNQKVKN